MNIHDRARQLVRDSHGERTLSEAYAELARRSAQARKYGRVRVTPAKDLAAVESPKKYWWQE